MRWVGWGEGRRGRWRRRCLSRRWALTEILSSCDLPRFAASLFPHCSVCRAASRCRGVCVCVFYMCVHFETNRAADRQTQEYCLSNPTLSGCVLVAGSYRFSADARSPRGVSRKGNGSHLWSFEEWIWVFLGSGSCHHLFLPNFLPCRCCFGLFTFPLGIQHCYGLFNKSV